MYKFLLFFIFIASTSFSFIGSGTAYLNGKSESGRTIFKAEIQDIEGLVTKASLLVDGVELSFNEDDNSHIIFDSKNGVYTIVIESKQSEKIHDYRFLKFWAIPKTFKTIVESSGESKYEFKAKLYSTEPRKGKDSQTPVIELNCTLAYRI
ncbi:MAG: hypothetical protein EAY72_04600 [Bacteroidetes bacterium]|nr:MAG: hypothetical protein EAY72_04600 [Bacteroidota bacterium]